MKQACVDDKLVFESRLLFACFELCYVNWSARWRVITAQIRTFTTNHLNCADVCALKFVDDDY